MESKTSKSTKKTLKLFNGRCHGRKYQRHHVYVAAYSVKQAAELVSMACFGEDHKDLISVSEISNYYHKNAWGNAMNGIEAIEPCVYMHDETKIDNKPFRVI